MEVKPCPHCGGTSITISEAIGVGKIIPHYNLICNKCFWFGATKPFKYGAIRAWNRGEGEYNGIFYRLN